MLSNCLVVGFGTFLATDYMCDDCCTLEPNITHLSNRIERKVTSTIESNDGVSGGGKLSRS